MTAEGAAANEAGRMEAIQAIKCVARSVSVVNLSWEVHGCSRLARLFEMLSERFLQVNYPVFDAVVDAIQIGRPAVVDVAEPGVEAQRARV